MGKNNISRRLWGTKKKKTKKKKKKKKKHKNPGGGRGRVSAGSPRKMKRWFEKGKATNGGLCQ